MTAPLAAPAEATLVPPGRGRLDGIDLLRGLVMVLMALDHARDYIGDFSEDPTNLATTTPALFFTRWVTHFCAPVFVFLAGTSAFLYGAKHTRGELSRFLWTRGLWLIALEFTVIHWVWMQALDSRFYFVQVIGAIGAAMVVLAGLVYLPTRVVAAVGLVIVAGHNLLDPIEPEDFGRWAPFWNVVHQQGFVSLGWGNRLLMTVYPLLPWIGVMTVGYAFGSWMQLERGARRRRVAVTGAVLCALFLVLRGTNLYGDPDPWATQESGTLTLLAFLDCEKYPPSLLYLAMTLGPSLLFLAAVDRERAGGTAGRWLVTFGRVPLFYYVAHLFLLHSASRLLHLALYGEPFRAIEDGLTRMFTGQPLPEWYGQPLWAVYLSWALAVLVLYPACRWYGGVKRRGTSRWWSYL